MNEMFNYTKEDLLSIISCEFKHHPEAQLRDYYKLFFQSYWGQGHFIEDIRSTMTYLEQEVAIMNETYLPIIQDISNGKGLYRISLSIIRDRFLSIDNYLSLFLDMKQVEIDWTQWAEDWKHILKCIVIKNPLIISSAEIEYCNQAIEQKKIISHSECFRLTYKPHYRVMLLSDLNKSIQITLEENL